MKRLLPLAALLLAGATSAQLPPGLGPNPYAVTELEPTPVRFTDALLPRLKVPAGFKIRVFARDLGNVRIMQPMPNGDLYVSRRAQGDVILLRDRNKDGVADGPPTVVAQNIKLAHGLAERNGKLYIAASNQLWVTDIQSDGKLSLPRLIYDNLPDAGQHSARTMAFGPDGMLYLNIGSPCNDCVDANPERATILRIRPDGSGREVYARGLRHTIGFDWHPVTKQLWGMDMGSDRRGDDQPPEELNRILPNTSYGWPWCYGKAKVDSATYEPPPGTTKEAYCPTTYPSVLEYTAHSAPIGFLFYTGSQFPASYKNDAFVAFRGSWNRSRPSGYKVVRVRYGKDGEPKSFEDFVTGWLIDPPASFTQPGDTQSRVERQQAIRPAEFGRVAGLAQLQDGSLLIAEDENGVIYRVAYTGSANSGSANSGK